MADMHHVVSSNIESVGFDEQGMHVLFKNGGLYIHDAPVGIFHQMLHAKSPGQFYANSVRGMFPHRKVNNVAPDAGRPEEQRNA